MASAGLLMMTSMLHAAFAFADDGDDIALIMGGTGSEGGTLPSGLPTQEFFDGVVSRYIDPAQPFFTGQPTFPGFSAVPLATPEQDYPFTGLNSLSLDASIAQGLTDLNTAITQTYSGDDLAVLGYSQSAAIATMEMEDLAASGNPPDASDLSFVLLGDPDNPESGLWALESTLPNMPDYYTVTPADTIYTTDIYTIQYDGFADFPQYPGDILADINAGMGMDYAHLDYASLTPEQLATAVLLPTSPDYYLDGGVTSYYLIPSETLPLLEPLRELGEAVPALDPIINPYIDLVQPDLEYLVNLGYDDPYTTYANVTETTSLFPNVNPVTFLTSLAQDTMTGVNAALADEGLPQISDAGLSELLSQLFPGLPNFVDLADQFSDNIFGSAGAELSPILTDLSAGPAGQAVTEFGVDAAVIASLVADPTWIEVILGSL
jgi:hypothetical protein